MDDFLFRAGDTTTALRIAAAPRRVQVVGEWAEGPLGRRLWIGLALVLLLGIPLRAQHEHRPTVSLTLGYAVNDFEHVVADTLPVVVFDQSFLVLTISGEESFFSLGYGTQGDRPALGLPELTFIEGTMGGGTHFYLSHGLGGSPVGVFLPVRTTLDMRYVGPTDIDEDDVSGVGDMFLVSGTLGLGLGSALHPAPRGGPTLLASSLWAIGVLSDIDDFPHTDPRLMRTLDLRFRARFERLFAGRAGLTFGLSYRSQRWADASPEAVQEVVDLIRSPHRTPRRRIMRMVHVGFNW